MGSFVTFGNIFIVLLSAAAIIFIIVRSSMHSKKQEGIKRRFLEEEEAANAVRKKEIDAELYYTADFDALPPIPADDPNQVMRCSQRKMIRFAEPISNLELKKLYGPAQMDIIAQYEENFSEYLKALTKWAVELALEDFEKNQEDVLSILETVISLGGEFRDTYKLAADIYAGTGDVAALDALLIRAEQNHFKDPNIQQQILEYIDMKKETQNDEPS